MTAFRFHLATTEIAFYLCFFAINTIFINLCSGLKASQLMTRRAFNPLDRPQTNASINKSASIKINYAY